MDNQIKPTDSDSRSTSESLSNQVRGHDDDRFLAYRIVGAHGIDGAGSGSVMISPFARLRLGFGEERSPRVKIDGHVFTVVVRSGLRDDVVVMVEGDRRKLGCDVGDPVVIEGQFEEKSKDSKDVIWKIATRMGVVKGFQKDADDPPSVRLPASLMAIHGLEEGHESALSRTVSGEKIAVVVREAKAAKRGARKMALRKELRTKLGANLNDGVILWVARPNSGDAMVASPVLDCGNRIELADGRIVDLEVDAIVNAANKDLSGGGGVDGAIHEAAGRDLMRACRKLGGVEVGKAKITPGFDLPAGHVFHAVGPIWKGGKNSEHDLLASCYRDVLAQAAKKKFESIAFPCISAGVYGFPMEDASIVAFREVQDYCVMSEYPKRILMCPYTDEEKTVYKELLARVQDGFHMARTLFVAKAKKGTPDDMVELTRRSAEYLSVSDDEIVVLKSRGHELEFRVGISSIDYPIHRIRINAKGRESLGVDVGSIVMVS